MKELQSHYEFVKIYNFPPSEWKTIASLVTLYCKLFCCMVIVPLKKGKKYEYFKVYLHSKFSLGLAH
jgi:hypothetical protein